MPTATYIYIYIYIYIYVRKFLACVSAYMGNAFVMINSFRLHMKALKPFFVLEMQLKLMIFANLSVALNYYISLSGAVLLIFIVTDHILCNGACIKIPASRHVHKRCMFLTFSNLFEVAKHFEAMF